METNLPAAPSYRTYTRIVASKCCCCRKSLTDAVSVSEGIGPICSTRYYDPLFVPTEAQVSEALGLLAFSGLPDTVIDGCLSFKNNARKFSNLLVYFASSVYDQRDEVFKVCKILRALGYTVLADKLEIDRIAARLTDKGDTIEAHIPDKATAAIRRIKGVQPIMVDDLDDDGPLLIDESQPKPPPRKIQAKTGRKLGWIVPMTARAHLECILGVYIPGELVSYGNGVLKPAPRRSWYDLRQFTNPPAPIVPYIPSTMQARMDPPTPVKVDPTLPDPDKFKVITGVNSTILNVTTPYNVAFLGALKKQIPYKDRCWNHVGKYWEVAAIHEATVKSIIATVFPGITV